MQNLKSPCMFALKQKWYPEDSAFLILRIIEFLPLKFAKYLFTNMQKQ